MSLLGIDIGSSSVKGVVFDNEGVVLSKAVYGYRTFRSNQNWAETDADEIWSATANAIKHLTQTEKSGSIEALAISSHGETVIPVDSKGEAVGYAIMNSDNRAVEELAFLEKELGREYLYSITGVPPHTMFALLKIMWLKKNRQEVFEKAEKFLSAGDFILSKLGAKFYTDCSLASRTMCFDIDKLDWSEQIISLAGLRRNHLPDIIPSGEKCAVVSNQIAEELGLNDNVVIAIGGHDQPCGAFGSGAYKDGDSAISAGTYESLNIITDEPKNDDLSFEYSFNSYPHIVKRKYINLGFFPAGFATEWFIDEFCFEDKIRADNEHISEYLYINERLKDSKPTNQYFLPYLVGSGTPYWDADAKGAFIGLTPNANRHSMFKTVFEGLAFELKLNIENMTKVVGRFDNIVISGGNSRLDFSVQLRADITGKKVIRANTSETVCKGAAMLAGIAVGIYKDYEDAVNKTAAVAETFAPNREIFKMYEEKYENYKKIYHAVREII